MGEGRGRAGRLGRGILDYGAVLCVFGKAPRETLSPSSHQRSLLSPCLPGTVCLRILTTLSHWWDVSPWEAWPQSKGKYFRAQQLGQ